jgi:hypothetical protein
MAKVKSVFVSTPTQEIINLIRDDDITIPLVSLEEDLGSLMDCLFDTDEQDFNPLLLDTHYGPHKAYVVVDIYNNDTKKFDRVLKLSENNRIADNIIKIDLALSFEYKKEIEDYIFTKAQQKAPDKVLDRDNIWFSFSYDFEDELMLNFFVSEKKLEE